MIIMWLVYSIVVGAMIVVSARLVERVALVFGWTTRYVWVAAMLLIPGTTIGTLGLRGYGPERTGREDSAQRADAATAPLATGWWQSLVPAAVSAPSESDATAFDQRIAALTERLSRFDRSALIAWALLTTFVGALVLHATLEGRRLLHACEAREMKGVRVLVTDAIGPAAVGLGATAILLPRWALELEDQLLDLVLRHEREHLEANDPSLLFYALVVIVLLPWQLSLWWAWQRLRLAIEVDCDARLLRDGRDTKRYAQLLLLMSQRVARSSSASRPFITVSAPLQPERSHLATRIQIMTDVTKRHALRKVIQLAIGIAATGSIAFAIPVPRRSASASVERLAQSDGRVIVRVTSVGMRDVETDGTGKIKGEILVYGTGGATLGLGNSERRSMKDTLHLKAMPAFTADVTDGEVHLKLIGSEKGKISLTATVTGGTAKGLSGEASYLVLLKGGTGIQTLASVPPLFVVDGARSTQEAAMKIARDSIVSVDVLKNAAALAKYGDEGKHGVVIITTRRGSPPKANAASDAPPPHVTDALRTYFEFQVDEPARVASGSGRPTYPAAEKAAGVEATVLAQFVVGTDGLVEPGSFRVIGGTVLGLDGKKQAVTKSENEYGPFEIAVRDAMPSLRFTPAKLKGVPVRQVGQQPFVFAQAKQ